MRTVADTPFIVGDLDASGGDRYTLFELAARKAIAIEQSGHPNQFPRCGILKS